MTFIKNLIAKLLGKKIASETGDITVASKTKIVALIAVILPAIEPISTAWGHPIHVPDVIYKTLAAAGLWALKDGLPPA